MVAIYPPEEFLWLADKHAHPEQIAAGLHVTLFYIGDTSPLDDNKLIQALQATMEEFKKPLMMKCAGPGCFYNESEGFFVRKLTMNAVGLDLLRVKVLQEMWKRGFVGSQTHGFSPHLTLQYHEDTDLYPGWEVCALEPYPVFPVDTLYLVRNNEVIAQVKLGGDTKMGGPNPAIRRLK